MGTAGMPPSQRIPACASGTMGALEAPAPGWASRLQHGWTCAGGWLWEAAASFSALIKLWVIEKGFWLCPAGWFWAERAEGKGASR